jgi:hypothetical protein
MFPLAFADDVPVPSKITEFSFRQAQSTSHCRRSHAELDHKSNKRMSKTQPVDPLTQALGSPPPAQSRSSVRAGLLDFVMGNAASGSMSDLPRLQQGVQRLRSELHASPFGDTALQSELERGGDHDVALKTEPTGAHTGILPAAESKPNPLTGDLEQLRALTMKRFAAYTPPVVEYQGKRFFHKQPDTHNIYPLKPTGFTKRTKRSKHTKRGKRGRPAADDAPAVSSSTDGTLTVFSPSTQV